MKKSVFTGSDGGATGIVGDGVTAILLVQQQIQRADAGSVFQSDGGVAGGLCVTGQIVVEQKGKTVISGAADGGAAAQILGDSLRRTGLGEGNQAE